MKKTVTRQINNHNHEQNFACEKLLTQTQKNRIQNKADWRWRNFITSMVKINSFRWFIQMDTKCACGYRSSQAEVHLEVKTVLKILGFSQTTARVCRWATINYNIFFNEHLLEDFRKFLEQIFWDILSIPNLFGNEWYISQVITSGSGLILMFFWCY